MDSAEPADQLRRLGWMAGIAGPVLLIIYFATPALVHWPFAGESAPQLITYANFHSLLFYAGGWLQATGAVLSILFLVSLLRLSGTLPSFAGLVTVLGFAAAGRSTGRGRAAGSGTDGGALERRRDGR